MFIAKYFIKPDKTETRLFKITSTTSVLNSLKEYTKQLTTKLSQLSVFTEPMYTHPIIKKLLGIMQEDPVFQQHWKIDRQTWDSIYLSCLFPVTIQYDAKMNMLVAKYFIKPDNPTTCLFNIFSIRSVLNSLNDLHNHQQPN
jgi:hypothetical protein